ncbi:hypothetical protein AAA288_01305 [Phocaeicola vulgatus]
MNDTSSYLGFFISHSIGVLSLHQNVIITINRTPHLYEDYHYCTQKPFLA